MQPPWVGALPSWTQEWHRLLPAQVLLDALLEPLKKEEEQLLEQWQVEKQSRQECQVGLSGGGGTGGSSRDAGSAAGNSPPPSL